MKDQDYDAYLFDWDGTLANSTEIWFQAVHENLLLYDLELPRDVVLKSLGDWRDLIAHGLPEEHFEAYGKKAGDEAYARLHEAALYEGVRELLYGLRKAGKKLAVVTAMPRDFIEKTLEYSGLQDFFDVVVSGSEVTHKKPHPESIFLALEQLGDVTPARAVMVGDTSRDLLAAEAAGADRVLFSPENAPFDATEIIAICKPTVVIAHWNDFAPHIAR
ncbi:MAG TPA: HAD family hydrolase [Candidatus Saccharimonadales bacterium]|nr:HAD family hydrolase [Candidatus Saccharimonadales bacterium]